MRVLLLGTGSAEGWPGLFCACDICRLSRERRGRNLRTRTSTLIDGRLKFDLPPDTLAHVHTHNLDLSALDFLVFTHRHDDHFAVRELQYMSWMFVPHERPQRLQIYAPADVTAALKEESDLDSLPISVTTLEPWVTVSLGPYALTPIRAQHAPDLISFNYLLERDGKTILYATDTGWYEEPTWRFLQGRRADAVIAECARGLDENGYKAHLSIPEVIRFRQRLVETGFIREDAPFFTTHHSHLSGLLHEEYEAHLAPHGITTGYDGLAFDLR